MVSAVRAAWSSELLKIRTVRGQVLGAAAATLAIPLFSLLVVSTGGLGAGNSVVVGASAGAFAGFLGFGLWSAAIVAGEFAAKTAFQSYLAVPRRTVLVLAKLGATAGVAGVGSLVGIIVSLVVVGAAAPGDPRTGAVFSLAIVPLVGLAVGVLGASIGLLTRAPVVAVASAAAVLVLPQAAGGLWGSLQPYVVGATPGEVVSQVVGSGNVAAAQVFPGGSFLASLTLLVVVGAIAVLAWWTTSRRDG